MKGTKLVTAFGGKLFESAAKNSHTVMGIAAIGGLVAANILWWIARPKVDDIIEEQKVKMDDVDLSEATDEEKAKEKKDITFETVKRVAPVVAPAAIVTLVTGGLMVGSIKSANQKISNFAGIATASDIAYKELYDKSREKLGDEKMDEIQKEIAEEKMHNGSGDDLSCYLERDGMVQAKGGSQPFYDVMSGRVFRSDVDTIMKAVIACNDRITSGREAYISLNEFYQELELPQVILADDRGWGGYSLSNMLEPNINNAIRLGDISVIVLDWYNRPTMSYK